MKIFRKIRQALISENRFTKYLLYAFGEIVLVVLGILIALQINNWNENRKQNNLEQEYLINLKGEYESNLAEVDRVITLNSDQIENAIELAKHTGPDAPNITDEEFSKLYFGTVQSEVQYRPGTGVTNEIISSGKLSIFQNKQLKKALAAMDGLLLRIRFQEKDELGSSRTGLVRMGIDQSSVRRMAHDAFDGFVDLDQGRFLDSNLHLLRSKEFDNHLTGFIYTAKFLEDRYEVLKKQLQEIIDIIDSQIE